MCVRARVLLRINKHIVGVDIDDQPRMDGQWLKITRNLFDSSSAYIHIYIHTYIHRRKQMGES